MIELSRIDEVELEVRPYTLRLTEPLRTARGTITSRSGFVVEARRRGRVGRGEACVMPELGTETLEECARELRGEEPRTPAARCALEQAVLDLDAQELGLPLAKLLDRKAQAGVECSALLTSHSMPDLAREARRAAAEGFRTLKLKVGLGDDFARAAVVRDAAGQGARLRLDANEAWDAIQALRSLRELAPLGIEFCEQPTRDLLGLSGCPVRLAADELCVRDFDAALARASVVVLKPMLLGGLRPALALARRAQQAGVGVVITTSLDGAIARAGAAHLAAAVGGPFAHGLATGRLLERDLCPDALAPRDGRVVIPDAPGLGL